MDDDVKLYCGDCLDVLRTLPDASVDAVVTDPPYGISYQSTCRTDRSTWFPKIANDESPCVEWLPDAFRLMRDGSPLICFCAWKTQEAFRVAIAEAGFSVRSHVIWDREWHGLGDLRAEFAPQHDVIWFATKGAFAFPGKRPKSVLRCPRISGNSLVHPNQKPLPLMCEILAVVTKPNDIVLDPYAGSGSTLLAAIRMRRRAIGVELCPKNHAIAERRIAQARERAALPLFDRHAQPGLFDAG